MRFRDLRWRWNDPQDPFECSHDIKDSAGNIYAIEIMKTSTGDVLSIAKRTPDHTIIEDPTELELACFLADKEPI